MFQKRIVEATGRLERARLSGRRAGRSSCQLWQRRSFEQSSVGIPHVVGGAMAVDAVMSMVGVGLGDAVVEAVLPGGEAMNAGGHAIEAHA